MPEDFLTWQISANEHSRVISIILKTATNLKLNDIYISRPLQTERLPYTDGLLSCTVPVPSPIN